MIFASVYPLLIRQNPNAGGDITGAESERLALPAHGRLFCPLPWCQMVLPILSFIIFRYFVIYIEYVN